MPLKVGNKSSFHTNRIIEIDIKQLQVDCYEVLCNLRNLKILITGCSGLLGNYLSILLISSNHRFNLNLDITCTSRGELPKSLMLYKNKFKYLKGDLTDLSIISQLEYYDCIFHLAGDAQPKLFISDPELTTKINTEVVLKLLSRCNPEGSFLFISSSEVYKNLESEQITEDMVGSVSPNHPRAAYVFSKLLGENFCLLELDKGKKNIKIIRLSMVYGPGVSIDDTRAISQFLYHAIFRDKIYLMDHGRAVREYLYISDAIRALLNALLLGKEQIYNVGSGISGSITIAKVAQELGKLSRKKVEFPKLDLDLLGASEYVHMDITRYENEFGPIMESDRRKHSLLRCSPH